MGANSTIRLLLFGDVVGDSGCSFFLRNLEQIRSEYEPDLVVVNGENISSIGRGISPRKVRILENAGVDCITTGNHVWACRAIYEYLDTKNNLLRPANYPAGCPGKGVALLEVGSTTVGIVNLIGNIFMRNSVNCPFRAADSILSFLKDKTKIVFIDLHAEATSEKIATAHYLDGRVSAVIGTHTHVQTNDAKILPGGTGFICDVGMTGAVDSILGVKKTTIISHLLTQLPHRFTVEEEGEMVSSFVLIDVDKTSGKCTNIEAKNVYGMLNA